MTSPRSSFAAQSRTSIIVIKIIVAFAVAIIINNLISMVIMSTMLVLDIVVARIDDVISFPYRADAKPAQILIQAAPTTRRSSDGKLTKEAWGITSFRIT